MTKRKGDFVVRGFAVDNGVNPLKLMQARKDMKFQIWLIWFVDKAVRGQHDGLN